MSEEALESALSGPASIAVHDDGDVLGNFVGVQLPIDDLLFWRQFVNTAGDGWAQNYLAVTDASIPRQRVQTTRQSG